MINAKEEFLEMIGLGNLKCACITYWEDSEFSKTILLKEGYNPIDLNIFLQNLNFEYDAGYGAQHVFGTVWYKDGSWALREEYDGSEWWCDYSLPEIPEELQAT